ncbi:MAG: GntR family transcriptional regulator [Bryobacterales bacterium]|nr:GntR family transcriptional regulator [Acidobacteriota bacterium]MCB9384814.1 GntR family transcriptional regulator [Bryobacterales bacterium]
MAKLEPLKSGLLAGRVAETIRRAIFSSHFQPGAQLLEAHLARELQVSQTTVREALVQLDRIGLVVRVPNKGSFVTNLSEQELRDRLAIRWLLEGLAWVEAARHLTEDGYAELQRMLDEDLASAIRNKDFPLAADVELEFHSVIWRNSGNPTLADTLSHLTPPLFVHTTRQRRDMGVSNADACERHHAILVALRTQDAAVIQQELSSHFGAFRSLFDQPSDAVQALAETPFTMRR